MGTRGFPQLTKVSLTLLNCSGDRGIVAQRILLNIGHVKRDYKVVAS